MSSRAITPRVDIIARKGSGLRSSDDLKGESLCGIQGAFYNKDMQDKHGADARRVSGNYRSPECAAHRNLS